MEATTCEVTRTSLFKFGRKGMAGAIFLGLGRALGETMAVTFVIGNAHNISASLFDMGSTIPSTLVNEFAAAQPAGRQTLKWTVKSTGYIT